MEETSFQIVRVHPKIKADLTKILRETPDEIKEKNPKSTCMIGREEKEEGPQTGKEEGEGRRTWGGERGRESRS